MKEKQQQKEQKLELPPMPIVIEKWNWKDKDEYIVMAVDTFTNELNNYGEMKHKITGHLVNKNNNKLMGPELFYWESNSPSVRKEFESYFKDWHDRMVGTRLALMMSSSTQLGLYCVRYDE